MRFYENGGSCIVSDPQKCIFRETQYDSDSESVRLTPLYSDIDWATIQSLWHVNGELQSKRLFPVDKYINEDL